MIPFMGETVCRAFNFVFIPVFLLLLYTGWGKSPVTKFYVNFSTNKFN